MRTASGPHRETGLEESCRRGLVKEVSTLPPPKSETDGAGQIGLDKGVSQSKGSPQQAKMNTIH